MYTVQVRDLPLLAVCGTRTGRNKVKLIIIISYHAYALTDFVKQYILKIFSRYFRVKFNIKLYVNLMKLFVIDFFSPHNLTLCGPCCLHISDPCTCIAQVKWVRGTQTELQVSKFGNKLYL